MPYLVLLCYYEHLWCTIRRHSEEPCQEPITNPIIRVLGISWTTHKMTRTNISQYILCTYVHANSVVRKKSQESPEKGVFMHRLLPSHRARWFPTALPPSHNADVFSSSLLPPSTPSPHPPSPPPSQCRHHRRAAAIAAVIATTIVIMGKALPRQGGGGVVFVHIDKSAASGCKCLVMLLKGKLSVHDCRVLCCYSGTLLSLEIYRQTRPLILSIAKGPQGAPNAQLTHQINDRHHEELSPGARTLKPLTAEPLWAQIWAHLKIELRASLITFTIFVRSQRLIARNVRELRSTLRAIHPLNTPNIIFACSGGRRPSI
jgi:hypothetical protein